MTSAQSIAAEVKAMAERLDLTAETLVVVLCMDARGNRYKARVDAGLPALPAADANDPAQQARMKSHLDFALLSEPSRRWVKHLRARAHEVQASQSKALGEWAVGLHNNPDRRPAAWLRALAAHLDEDIAMLRRMQQDQQAGIKRIDADLQPLQAQIAADLNPGQSGPGWTRLFDFVATVATTVVQTVSRGVGLTLTGKVCQAEQLVNEREELAFNVDAIASAVGVMQEARAWALAQLDMIARLRGRCVDAERWLSESRAGVVRRLARQPYAHIDVTSVGLAERIGAALAAQIPGESLAYYAALDDGQLRNVVVAPAADQARALVSGLNWIQATELAAALLPGALAPADRASSRAPNGVDSVAGAGAAVVVTAGAAAEADAGGAAPDLALDAVQMLLDRAGADSLSLIGEANARDWQMIGLEDESNPPLSFGNASLVSVGRRDQLQILRVQTGIHLGEVAAYRAASGAFDQASRGRNFLVMPELANDDPARRAFGLGLACGCIGAEAGQYMLRNVRLHAEDGGGDDEDGAASEARIALGARIEDAIEMFARHPAWAGAVSLSVDAVPLVDLASRMQSWLARNRAVGRGEGEELRRELVGYVRDRLAAVSEQLKYTGEGVFGPAPATAPAATPAAAPAVAPMPADALILPAPALAAVQAAQDRRDGKEREKA
jgi:hypothetical protein